MSFENDFYSSLEFYDKVYVLFDILEKAKNLFSKQIFIRIFSGTAYLVIVLFDMIAFILNPDIKFNLEIGLYFGNFIGYALHNFTLMHFINCGSDSIKDCLKKMKLSMYEIQPLNNRKFIIGGKLLSAENAKQLALNRLNEFSGYDGMGYFYAGNQLMTGILANTITYIIVLVQFLKTE